MSDIEKEGIRMATVPPAMVSLAPLFGDTSMAAWHLQLLENRHCMDCKMPIEGLAGAMAFVGLTLFVYFKLARASSDRSQS